MTSYKAQVRYYTETLSKMPNTEFVGVYADEGISGTSVKHRKNFQRLMADCRDGKIDEIWVKSISRFSRNIVDCLQHIRELKALSINIHFEGINVDTLDSKGELLIIILASIAEEESRNISENQRWRYEKDFAMGKMAVNNLYGYKRDDNKQFVIDIEKAPIVRRIFNKYLSGLTTNQIADRLNDEGIPTYFNRKWSAAGIMRMLENEKYKGDAVLQKTYSPSFLSKRRVKNEGQAKMYYVENSHAPIIERDIFDKVQAEMKRRNDLAAEGVRRGGKYSHNQAFSGKIKCGECGDILRRHGHNYKGEKTALWLCKTKQLSKGSKCSQPHIKEQAIEDAFVSALNKLIGNKDEFIAGFMEAASQIITDKEQADYDLKAAELDAARDEMLALSKAHSKHEVSAADYHTASLKVMEKIDLLTAETQAITEIINTKKTVKHRLTDIQKALSGDILESFDTMVFTQLVSMVTIKNSKELEFAFHCGITATEIL